MNYFTEHHSYTNHAGEVSAEIERFLADIYKREVEAGYSPRELSSIVIGAIGGAEAGICLELSCVLWKKQTADLIAEAEGKLDFHKTWHIEFRTDSPFVIEEAIKALKEDRHDNRSKLILKRFLKDREPLVCPNSSER